MNTDTALQLSTAENLIAQFSEYVPLVLAAALVLVVGWLIASAIGKLAERAVRFTGVDKMVGDSRLNERLNISNSSQYALLSRFVGTVVKWLLFVLALALASDILNLPAVNEFLGTIIGYIPQAIVAVIILTVGVIAGQFASRVLQGFLATSSLSEGNRTVLSSLARWAIIVFAVMAALTQLGIVPQLIEILFAGVVFALALAFGLGGREHASDFLKRLKEQG